MANCKKATRGAMGHLMKHYERAKDENGEYIKFGNLQIDSSKSDLNYNLAPHRDNQLDFMQKRLKEVHVLKRKDVNVMCSWVVTAPKELPEEHHKEFFECTYEFLKQRYNPTENNIISAYVHLDEATPHIHFAFIPIVHDKKKGYDKVSAKEVINRTDLQTFHKDFQAYIDNFIMQHNYEFECNVLNGATAGGNKTIEEYKAELLYELNEQENERLSDTMARSSREQLKLENIEEQIKNLSKRSVRLQNDVFELQRDKSTLIDQINALEGKYDALNSNTKVLMQKFIEHPQISELFEKFCKKELENIKSNQEQRKSVKSTLARYKAEAEKYNKSQSQNQEHNRQKLHNDLDR